MDQWFSLCSLGCGKNKRLRRKGSAPSVDLKAWTFGRGWGSCLELVQRGPRAGLIPLSLYQTSCLVQGLEGLLVNGITADVCVPGLPKSLCVRRGLLKALASWVDSHRFNFSVDRHRSWDSDSHALGGRVLKICSCTPLKYTRAQMMDKVHIPLDSPAGRLLTFVTLSSSSARDASKWDTRKENSCHFVLKHAGSFSV